MINKIQGRITPWNIKGSQMVWSRRRYRVESLPKTRWIAQHPGLRAQSSGRRAQGAELSV